MGERLKLLDERGVKARRGSSEERAVLLWCVVFKNELQAVSCTEEQTPREMVLQRFQHAMALGMHDGRAVIGMWLIDPEGEPPDVPIAIYGRVTGYIRAWHEAYLRRKKS